ncbi:suppressor protein SRP40 [Cladophialophora carrionii]|uniref:Suppressor protein SRP40 n=1 Tax=Cladophialophora carrionii TaxID=86049 RepID=A0A1C1CQ33_9EURO|nr:suppressor protein SRP40 [Cladophialophora carrionii]
MVPDLMRLHITPFNPDLSKVVVGPHLLDVVSSISYHSIQTFPENNYGYIELPRMEGEKLKKKLHGAILKGKKIKIEEARPKKRRRIEESEEETARQEPKGTTLVKATTAKKSKQEHNVVAGHELPAGRKVKRGWTEARSTRSSKKDKPKTQSSTSKYTDKDELLFRTRLPVNKSDLGMKKKEKGRPKGQKNGDHTVHEFEKSTLQPSFLKQEVRLGIKGNLQYVEGQGWLDESGRVVETEKSGTAKLREIAEPRPRSQRTLARTSDQSSAISSSSSDEDESHEAEEIAKPAAVDSDNETSSSGSSSASESEETHETTSPRPASDFAETNEGPEVHPLEALFKKPKNPASQDVAKPSLEISTSFSFFDAENADDVGEEEVVPLTPFSSQEYRSRGLRSAAPTPDTAHPSRFNSYGSSGLPGDEDMEEDEEPRTHGRSSKVKEQPAETPSRTQSEFEKKFLENRADNNRAWKLRRRTVLKEKRQRENKARRPRNW